MKDTRKDLSLPISDYGLTPELIESLKQIKEGRHQVKENTVSSSIREDMFGAASGWVKEEMLLCFLNWEKDRLLGKLQIHEAWKSANTTLGRALKLPDSFEKSTPELIAKAIVETAPELEARVDTRNFLLGIIREELIDNQIIGKKAVEITTKFLDDAESEYPLDNEETYRKMSDSERSRLIALNLQALHLCVNPKISPHSGELKERVVSNFSRLAIADIIHFNWSFSELRREENNKVGELGKTHCSSLSAHLKNLEKIVKESKETLPYDMAEVVANMIRTLGQSAQLAFTEGEISRKEYLEAALTIADTSWEILANGFSDEDKVKLADGQHSILSRSGNVMAAMAKAAPWNGDEKQFLLDVANEINTDGPMLVYCWASIAYALALVNKETHEALKANYDPLKDFRGSKIVKA